MKSINIWDNLGVACASLQALPATLNNQYLSIVFIRL